MRVRTPKGVHHVHSLTRCVTVVHLVRYIVHMKKPVHEITSGAKLWVGGVRVAHGGKQAGLEAMKCALLPFAQIATAEEPSLALHSGLLPMAIIPEWEVAM